MPYLNMLIFFKFILGIQDKSAISGLTSSSSPGVAITASSTITVRFNLTTQVKKYNQFVFFFNKIQHALYSSSTYLNDIALVILSTKVNLTNYIQPACLPTSVNLTYPGTSVWSWVAGSIFKNLKIYKLSY